MEAIVGGSTTSVSLQLSLNFLLLQVGIALRESATIGSNHAVTILVRSWVGFSFISRTKKYHSNTHPQMKQVKNKAKNKPPRSKVPRTRSWF